MAGVFLLLRNWEQENSINNEVLTLTTAKKECYGRDWRPKKQSSGGYPVWDKVISSGRIWSLQALYYCCLKRPKGHA